MKNIAILGVGIAIGYFLFRKANVLSGETVKVGDKSKDIEGMQKSFEKIANLKFDEYGQYDSDTLEAAKYLLSGTQVMNENGSLDGKFVRDLSRMHFNTIINPI